MPEQPTPAAEPQTNTRSTQYAVGVLAFVVLLLIGVRWFTDRAGTKPAELVREPTPQRIDLNRASRSELIQLPGVGAGRVDKILAYRETKGNFKRVEDLRRVDGIGDVTVEKLKKYVHVDAVSDDEPLILSRKVAEPASWPSMKKPAPEGKIDLNKAGVADFMRIPGIGPVLAQRIVEERKQKPFAMIDDLRRVSGIGVKTLDKIKPYVVVEN
ncbi:MAG: ComEA family DNA-binding protein [Planctomycetes bacterium]|nr:ComEA family DNA-binding protein [Planctomycetota bacterium]